MHIGFWQERQKERDYLEDIYIGEDNIKTDLTENRWDGMD
jgi:hypothetical protein